MCAALAVADHSDQAHIEASDGDIVLSVPDGKAVYINSGERSQVGLREEEEQEEEEEEEARRRREEKEEDKREEVAQKQA